MTLDRRSFIGGTLALGASLSAAACIPPDTSPLGRLAASLRIIEAGAQGTLGVEFVDTGSGLAIGHNRNMRFGHCSSFKLSLAAMVLARDVAGVDDADRRVTWSESDLMNVSPFTTERLSTGASLRELAEATQKTSDNAAANVLLREVGGPEALTAFWRTHGDMVSRLDRIEPDLNEVPAGEERDSSTPAAMARTVARLAYGSVLPDAERALLRQWMVDTGTGLKRVRAGLPEGWRAGDKTGTSTWPVMNGDLYVDIGFVEPPSGAPITFAAYFRAPGSFAGINPAAEAVLAQVGRVLAEFARVRPS